MPRQLTLVRGSLVRGYSSSIKIPTFRLKWGKWGGICWLWENMPLTRQFISFVEKWTNEDVIYITAILSLSISISCSFSLSLNPLLSVSSLSLNKYNHSSIGLGLTLFGLVNWIVECHFSQHSTATCSVCFWCSSVEPVFTYRIAKTKYINEGC